MSGIHRRTAWIALAAGAVIFALALAYAGVGDVLRALATAGLGTGLVLVARVPVILFDAASLRALLPKRRRPHLLRMSVVWWVGDSVNGLLPVAQIGGEVVRARLLARGDLSGAVAGGAVVACLTLGVLSLIGFAAVGAILLSVRGSGGGEGVLGIAIGLTVLAGLLAGFYRAQHNGLFARLARLIERVAGGRSWLSLGAGAAELDAALRSIYVQRAAVMRAALWRLAAWLAGVGEVWIGLAVLGHPVSLADAFILESLAQAIRAAGFAIPGALGIQEGGLMGLGLLLGLPPEAGVALSLLKRVRDLAFGVPGLIYWQWLEGKWLMRGRNDASREAG